MRTNIYLILIVLIISSCASKKEVSKTTDTGPRPEWVASRPIDSQYYIGIGRATIGSTDPMASAKANALQDLASEIEVKIDANSLMYQFENNSSFKEQFLSNTKLKTRLQLEGYESVASFSDEKHQYVYYRLDKVKYQTQQREKLLKALDKAQLFYANGQLAESKENYSVALGNYINAMISIEEHLNESMKVEGENGGEYYFDNQLYSDIQKVLDKIQIQKENPIIETTPGFELKGELTQVVVTEKNDIPIASIPIVFESKFIKKRIQTTSSSNGLASASLGVVSKKGSGVISVMVDLKQYFKSPQPITEGVLLSLRIPSDEISIVSESPRIYLEVDLKHKSSTVNATELVQGVSSALISNSFQAERDRSKAHYIMAISANTEEAGEYEGLFTTNVLGFITLEKVENSQVIFNEKINGVKGVALNYDEAAKKGINALNKSLTVDVVPRIRRQLLGD